MNIVPVTPRDPQHAVRCENGQYAKHVTTQKAIVNQELVNQNLDHWQWLKDHGYAGVQPFEVFSAPRR